MVEDVTSFGKAVIRELLLLVCVLLRDGLTVLSMWPESMSAIDFEQYRRVSRALLVC